MTARPALYFGDSPEPGDDMSLLSQIEQLLKWEHELDDEIDSIITIECRHERAKQMFSLTRKITGICQGYTMFAHPLDDRISRALLDHYSRVCCIWRREAGITDSEEHTA